MKILPLLMASASIAACAAQARSPEPVPVDRVECASCRMLISNDAGAAEIVSARDETRFYDDVGCLAADWQRQVKADPAYGGRVTAFVRVNGGGWSDVRSAWFARPDGARTAMASGLVAYATRDEAQRADRDRRALTWTEVAQ